MSKFQDAVKRSGAAIATTVGLATIGSANAAGLAAPDLTDITSVVTGIGLVGAAVFGVFVAVKGFHWLRRAL